MPRRSKEAFAALTDAWEGILVSDGYGVYQRWGAARQTCVAHLIRRPAAWRSVLIQTWRPVEPGHWQSCNGSVIWPPPHLLQSPLPFSGKVCHLTRQPREETSA